MLQEIPVESYRSAQWWRSIVIIVLRQDGSINLFLAFRAVLGPMHSFRFTGLNRGKILLHTRLVSRPDNHLYCTWTQKRKISNGER